jgi:hypothetical protein
MGYITSPIKKLFAAFIISSSVKMIGTYKPYYEKYMMIINGLGIFAV